MNDETKQYAQTLLHHLQKHFDLSEDAVYQICNATMDNADCLSMNAHDLQVLLGFPITIEERIKGIMNTLIQDYHITYTTLSILSTVDVESISLFHKHNHPLSDKELLQLAMKVYLLFVIAVQNKKFTNY